MKGKGGGIFMVGQACATQNRVLAKRAESDKQERTAVKENSVQDLYFAHKNETE